MSVYRKAQRGSIGDRSARRTNDVSESALAFKRTQRGMVPSRGVTAADAVLVRNDSGLAQPKGAVMHVTGCAVTPSDDAESVYGDPVLTVDVPSGDNIGTGVVVVLLEPLVASQVGAAAIDGVCFAQVSVRDADHGYATEVDADATKFESAASGVIRILYKPAGTGTSWCVVRLSAGGPTTWVWAKVQSVGTSTFTAKLVDDAGSEYGDAITVGVYAAILAGFTTAPLLATMMPWIKAGELVQIEKRSGFREGWWLVGSPITTCSS